MVTQTTVKRTPIRTQLDVLMGSSEKKLGKLIFVKDGQREYSQFAYSEEWLLDTQYFDVSPDLNRQMGYQLRKASTNKDSCFFMAMADTEPDAWGRRVIARKHAKARAQDKSLRQLTHLDCLGAVDDFSRIGALRLRDEKGNYMGSGDPSSRSTPAFFELEKILLASRAVELSKETTEDLTYLQGKGTSLGGMRPKCTILDVDGALSIGKFPSVNDERAVTRGEVLALRLAKLAGIDSAPARIVMVKEQPVAMIRRFDRTPVQNRIPYISGSTFLQANREDEHSYTEIIDVMRSKCENFVQDSRQLWRRLVFNLLITNVDDHLQNIGFLYSGNNQWRLAPAFDLNPFPDKDPESKTWLSEDSGPIASIDQLLQYASQFELSQSQAQSIVGEVFGALRLWKEIAITPEVGLQAHEINAFKPAFKTNGAY